MLETTEFKKESQPNPPANRPVSSLKMFAAKSWHVIDEQQHVLDTTDALSPAQYIKIYNQIQAQKTRLAQRIRSEADERLIERFQQNSLGLFEVVAQALLDPKATKFRRFLLKKMCITDEALTGTAAAQSEPATIDAKIKVVDIKQKAVLIETLFGFVWTRTQQHKGRPSLPVEQYIAESQQKIKQWRDESKQRRHEHEVLALLRNKISSQRSRIVSKVQFEQSPALQQFAGYQSNFKKLVKLLGSAKPGCGGEQIRRRVLRKLGAARAVKMSQLVCGKARGRHSWWFVNELEKHMW